MHKSTNRSDRTQPRVNFVEGSQSRFLEKQLDKLDKIELNNEESKDT